MHSAAESFSDLHKLAYSLAEKKKYNPDQSPTDLAFDLRFIDIIDDNGKLKPNPNGSESQSDR